MSARLGQAVAASASVTLHGRLRAVHEAAIDPQTPVAFSPVPALAPPTGTLTVHL